MRRQPQLLVTALLVLGLHAGQVSQACNIPVFRYALENWHPDPYLAFVLHRGELSATQQQLVGQLQETVGDTQRPANVQVYVVDVERWRPETPSTETPSAGAPEAPEIPAFLTSFLREAIADRDLSAPQVVALYPAMVGHPAVAWQGALDGDTIRALVDSPLRQEIAKRLLAGQSAVWVLIESGDEAADREALALLESEVERLKSQIQLPAREVIESDEYYRPDVDIQLRVEFSVVRVRRQDVQEAAFASMLLGSEPDLRDFREPIAIPIYGRGRTYFALVGKGINAEMIEESCRFLCGACSCVVKEQNPGVDMLLAVDWDRQVVGTAMPEVVLPELTGVGALDMTESGPSKAAGDAASSAEANATAPSATNSDDTPATPAAAATAPPVVAPTRDTGSAPRFEVNLLMWLLGIVATGLVLAAVATVLLRRQASLR